ncbi:unnamed protein product [Caenorhabditis angaria]|uniref:Uncharacterized protein n=1 Tax=Caenorhabditis angaria TaxID=860376 RepID=A0A9P1IEI5_9PELO|nr:unnamed protein product [Caenorhabditis angaria]
MFLVLFQILNNFCFIIYLINICGAKPTTECPVRKVGDSVRGNVDEAAANSTRTAKVLKKNDEKDERSKKSKKQKKTKKEKNEEKTQKTHKTEVETQASVMAASAKEVKVNMRPSTTVVHSLRARPSTHTQVQTQESPQQSNSAMAPVSKIAYPSTMGAPPLNQAQ